MLQGASWADIIRIIPGSICCTGDEHRPCPYTISYASLSAHVRAECVCALQMGAFFAWHCAALWQAAPPYSALPSVAWGILQVLMLYQPDNHCLVWVQAWSAQMSEGWLSGEDLLLARAMRRFGKQQLKIQQYFLPTRTAADISTRIKHLTRISAPPNPVKV